MSSNSLKGDWISVGHGKTSLFVVFDPFWKEKSYCYLSAAKPFEKLSHQLNTNHVWVFCLPYLLSVSQCHQWKEERDRAASHADIDITWHLLEIKVNMTRSLFLRQSQGSEVLTSVNMAIASFSASPSRERCCYEKNNRQRWDKTWFNPLNILGFTSVPMA